MTVKELRQALNNIPDDASVIIETEMIVGDGFGFQHAAAIGLQFRKASREPINVLSTGFLSDVCVVLADGVPKRPRG